MTCSCGRWHRIEWPSKFWRSEFGCDRSFVTCDRCGDRLNADGTVTRFRVDNPDRNMVNCNHA